MLRSDSWLANVLFKLSSFIVYDSSVIIIRQFNEFIPYNINQL